MATKRITAYPSGSTLYDMFRDQDGQVLNSTTLALESWGASSHTRADYAFELTDQEGDLYTGAFDSGFPIGVELYRSVHLQVGDDPADTDPYLYVFERIKWTGESVIIDGEEASITDLCNYALVKVGGGIQQDLLSSYFETSNTAEKFQLLWPKVRKEVLIRGSKEGMNWQESIAFSETGAELEDDSIPDMADWEYSFALPSDCLRVIRQVDEDDHTVEYEFKVMRGMLLSNHYSNSDADCAYIEYIFDNDDVTTYGAALYNAMATLLASEIAGVLVGDKRRADLRAEFEGLVMQLAASQQQSQVYHDDKGASNIADRRHNRYGRNTS